MNVDKSLFRWDRYSDQPATIHRRIRRRLRRHAVRDELRKWLVALSLPRFLLQTWWSRNRFEAFRNDDRIGLCINLERPFENKKILSGSDIAEIIGSLNLSRIVVRIPLHDIERLEEYVAFIEEFPEYEILVVVLQDREHIEDKCQAGALPAAHLRRPFRNRRALSDRQRGEPAQMGIPFAARVPRVLRGGLEPPQTGSSRA